MIRIALLILLSIPCAEVHGRSMWVKSTAYCPCKHCSGGYGNKTCTGKRARQGHTIAVDKRIIKLGSIIRIGKKKYIAEDVGVKGYHIDIFFRSHKSVKKYGSRRIKIRVTNPR